MNIYEFKKEILTAELKQKLESLKGLIIYQNIDQYDIEVNHMIKKIKAEIEEIKKQLAGHQ